jgi:PKD repeat protein
VVTGEVQGTTTLSVTVNRIDDDDGGRIEVTTVNGTVQVRALPPVVGDGRPSDVDGDGLYEDVNGNGRIDFNDVVVLFENIDQPVVADNADAYDFNGNGRIDFDDVVALFEEIE